MSTEIINESTGISLKVIIGCVMCIMAIGGFAFDLSSKVNGNVKAINKLENIVVKNIETTSKSMSGIQESLAEILIEQRISNEIETYKTADRWTLENQHDYNLELLITLQTVLPELRIGSMPCVADIVEDSE